MIQITLAHTSARRTLSLVAGLGAFAMARSGDAQGCRLEYQRAPGSSVQVLSLAACGASNPIVRAVAAAH